MAQKKQRVVTTISVPDELKRRMATFTKRTPINWSAVACRAFENELQREAANTKGDSKMEAAVTRLRKLAAEEANDAEQEGREAGHDWACNTATPKQLRHLAKLSDEDLQLILDEDANSAYGPAERLAFVFLPKDAQDRAEANYFWQGALGNDGEELEVDFLAGFVKGAQEAWDKIEPQL